MNENVMEIKIIFNTSMSHERVGTEKFYGKFFITYNTEYSVYYIVDQLTFIVCYV